MKRREAESLVTLLNYEMEKLNRSERFETSSHWLWEVRCERPDGATVRMNNRQVWLFVRSDDQYGEMGHGHSYHQSEHKGRGWKTTLVQAAVTLAVKPLPTGEPEEPVEHHYDGVRKNPVFLCLDAETPLTRTNEGEDLHLSLRTALQPIVEEADEQGMDMAQLGWLAVEVIQSLVADRTKTLPLVRRSEKAAS